MATHNHLLTTVPNQFQPKKSLMKTDKYLSALSATLFFLTATSFLLSQEAPKTSESTVAIDEVRRQIDDEQIIITWSKKQDELRGFSTKLGEWSVFKQTPQSRLSVSSGGTVACVRLDDSLVAYSGEMGWWDVIPLPKKSTAVAEAERGLVTIQEGEHLYTFAASKGQWTSPTDPELQPVEGTLSIYANYKQLSKIQFNRNDPMLAHRNRQIDVNYTTPSGFPEGWFELTIRAGRKSYFDEVIKAFKAIELVPPLKKTPDNDSSPSDEKAPASDQELQAKIASLSEKMTRLESEAVAMGKSLSSKKAPTDEERQGLAERVSQSFDARQEMQLLESRLMSLKLAKVNENLTARQTLRSRIVERRVAELLDPSSEATSWKNPKTESIATIGQPANSLFDKSVEDLYSIGLSVSDKVKKEHHERWSEKAIWDKMGIKISVLPASSIPGAYKDYKGGLRVVNVRDDSPADQAGVKFGDIIFGIMDWQVPSMASLEWVLSNSQFLKSREAKYYIIRKGTQMTLVLSTPSKDTVSQVLEPEAIAPATRTD